jgi:hypothetical protein
LARPRTHSLPGFPVLIAFRRIREIVYFSTAAG